MLTRSRNRSLSARAIHNLGGGRRFAESRARQRQEATTTTTGSGSRIEGLWRHVLWVKKSGKKTLGGGFGGKERRAMRHSVANIQRGKRGEALGLEHTVVVFVCNQTEEGTGRGRKKETAMSGLNEDTGTRTTSRYIMVKCVSTLGISYFGWSPSTAAHGPCTGSLCVLKAYQLSSLRPREPRPSLTEVHLHSLCCAPMAAASLLR